MFIHGGGDMQSNQSEITAALKRTNLFYVIFGIVAPALFIALGYYVAGSQKPRPEVTEKLELLLYLYLLASMIGIVFALIIRWKIPGFFIKGFLKKRIRFNRPPGYPDFITVAQSLTIIMFAFLEGCTLYGLMMVILGFDPNYIWLFVPFNVIGCLIVLTRNFCNDCLIFIGRERQHRRSRIVFTSGRIFYIYLDTERCRSG